jgi:hypothetical protein
MKSTSYSTAIFFKIEYADFQVQNFKYGEH